MINQNQEKGEVFSELVLESSGKEFVEELFSDIDRILAEEKELEAVKALSLEKVIICEAENNREKVLLGKNFDKMLLALTCSYLMGVLLWIVINEQLKMALVTGQEDEVVAEKIEMASDDAEFMKYMGETLKAIDYEKQINELKASKPVRENKTFKEELRRTQPIYGLEENLSLTNALAQLNTTPQLFLLTTKPQKKLGEEEGNKTAKASSEVKLVGLLEAGDRSVALFTINGVTHRIQVGENIGTTGGTLISVAPQQVTINRNGELLYIAVGDKF
ncbi:MAG: hypothetical protein DSM107014_03585 [Gomphosphaeria aponina SAG 52.96 = DSM 107014]|uniref:Uncharacterized protein n=1 Tax=Gomphosphaeria aponina SAG 52.96 = DSM 107014 TaxID=1521640 RepID=A0A941GQ45_9CHRO|nr:hypothetical protein [Gomphosphaeria aponina SAG 52.96 = DSM 107014]